VLEGAVQAGADSLGLEYQDRDLIVYYNFGNTGLGAARITKGLQQPVIRELIQQAGLSLKRKGTMQVKLFGEAYDVQVEEHEYFGESSFNLTLKENRKKAGGPTLLALKKPTGKKVADADQQVRHKLGWDRARVLRQVAMLVPRALDEGLQVCVGGEDASRADFDFVLRVLAAAERAGARRFRFADTVGVLEPFRTYIVGSSPPMRRVLEQIRAVAKWTTTVLIRGESGIGKELIASAIHSDQPALDGFRPLRPRRTWRAPPGY